MENYLECFFNLKSIPTDFDDKFIIDFTNIYLTISEDSLNKLASYYRNHFNSTGESSQVLLAFYIEILRQSCYKSASILDKQNVIEFLLETENLIFENVKSSATLQQMAYNLLCTFEECKFAVPFNIDLNNRIISKLSSENTNLYVRRSVESLAIQHLKNIHLVESSLEKSSYLLFNLTEHLLESDYHVIIDSLARVIFQFLKSLNESQSNRLMNKAKNMKKLGFPFIQLIASLFLKKFDNLNILKFFKDFNAQNLIIIEIWKSNKETCKFKEWTLLDILMENPEKSVNFLISIVRDIKYDSVNTSDLFLRRLINFIGDSRYCSLENVKKFINFSYEIGIYSKLLPKIIEILMERILESSEILRFFPSLNSDSKLDSEIFKNKIFCKFLEKFVENVLIETSFKDCENGWEKRDSALEILEICYENLSLDMEKLLQNLIVFGTSITENQFVRSKSRKVLLNILKRDGEKYKSYKLNMELIELCKEQCQSEENDEMESQLKVQQIGAINAQKAELDDIIQAMQNTCCLNDCVSKECF